MKATYISIWDGIEISSNCEYDKNTNTVSDIDSIDVQGIENLQEEYIELEDGSKITDFIVE